jgi:hypothetical protein
MKIVAASLIAFVGSASAFTTAPMKMPTALRMADVAEPIPDDAEAMPEVPTEPELPKMSQSMPFMMRPAALTGELAGDVGFDPFGFAKTPEDLLNYREAEVKHARLAMLAAAGWPISELFDKKIASVFGLTPVLDAADRAPSLLNGGLGKISPIYWIGILGMAAAIDFYGIQQSRSGKPDYFPGNLGFDPLGVFPKDAEGQKWMQTAEIKNGRLAMIAITAFAFQEFVTKLGVVDETPVFFKPISQALHEYANTGYIHP